MPKLTTVRVGSFEFVVDDGLWAKHAAQIGVGNYAERLELACDVSRITEAMHPVAVARFQENRQAIAL